MPAAVYWGFPVPRFLEFPGEIMRGMENLTCMDTFLWIRNCKSNTLYPEPGRKPVREKG